MYSTIWKMPSAFIGISPAKQRDEQVHAEADASTRPIQFMTLICVAPACGEP